METLRKFLVVPNSIACSFSLSRLVCVLSQKKVLFPFLPFLPILFYGGPFYSTCLASQTVFDFLSQRRKRLCHFILDIMDYFLAGEDQQQTNQPNDMAGSTLIL